MVNCQNPECTKRPLFPKKGFCDSCYSQYLDEVRKKREEDTQQSVVDNCS